MKLLQGLHVYCINRPVIHLLTIAGLVFLIYSNTFNASFQFDDLINIVDNPAIKTFHYFSNPSSVTRIDKIDKQLKPLFKTRYIGYLTFALNYRLHGLDVMGYHLVNILIHIFNSLLLYWLMTLTFRTPFFSTAGGHLPDPHEIRNFIAVFTALFFAVHPVQTQAVTYIVQRFTSLATLFYLFSLVIYIKWKEIKEHQTKRYVPFIMLYAFSLLSAVLAMKTKEFAFTLPVVMTVYELMFYEGKVRKRLLYLVPFFLAVLFIPLSLVGIEDPLAVLSSINVKAVNISGAGGTISRGDYLFTQFRVIVTYIRLLFFPVNQNIDYDYPIYNSFFDPAVVLSFFFLLSVIIAGIYLYRLSKHSDRKDRFWLRLLSFGIFWFFMSLFAESGVIPIIDVIYEHRVYLPSVGFFIALTSSIVLVYTKLGSSASYAKRAVAYSMLTALLALSGTTYVRNTVWTDSYSLWKNAVEGSPNKARPHFNLGVAYGDQGRLDEAINEYQTVLKLKPNYVAAYNNLGRAYEKQDRIDEAINEYQTVLKLKPNYAEAHNNLGLAYAAQGRTDEAMNEYITALNLNPAYVEARYNLGTTYMSQGRNNEAIKEYQIVMELNPDYLMTRQFLEFLQKK
ncbi:MAG: tetratricopeptide repeat protein [Nitrospirae bacterium]|nr:tetratricopeptide repeat protein [Nitrospirota bacterium]